MLRQHKKPRLQEALSETDVFDDRGNVLISQGLKVRHKDTQFEYTVDDVIEDPETGKTMIKLKLPEEPRFEPPPEDEGLIADVPPPENNVLGEQDPPGPGPGAPAPAPTVTALDPEVEPEPELFVIDQEEFEKEYEVK